MATDVVSVLPRVGDVFPSLSHFKIAVHAAALELGIDLCILHGNSQKALLHCRLFTGSTFVKLGEGTRCEFSIAADRLQLDSDEVKVISRTLEHSCDATLRAKRREIAAEYTREKLKAVRTEAGAMAPLPTIEDNNSSESWPSSADSTENEDDDELRHQPASSSQSAQKKSSFPPAKELKTSANKLLELFPSARSLLTTLVAHALSDGYLLMRKSSWKETSNFKLICSRAHHRYQQKCGVWIEASADEEGRWSVDSSFLDHNHKSVVDPVKPDFYADNSRSRDKRQPAPSPVRPNKRLKLLNEPTPPPHSAACLPLPILTTLAVPLAPLDLSAFLHALFQLDGPSDDLDFLALVLNSHGIASVSDLALYLQLEVSSLGALVEEVQVRSGSEAAQGLAQLARELKRGAR